jgi:NADH/F420H2 dehydrogenase subunit C
MEKEAQLEKIIENCPKATAMEGGEWLNVQIPSESLHKTMLWLRDDPTLKFDYLFCLTCVDWLKHLTMVYHLNSIQYRHSLVLKVVLDREDPKVDTVSDIWRTAEFHEREVYEMYGVHFDNHPDLRKLILPDDWVGYPMRKDYDDPINMIKL